MRRLQQPQGRGRRSRAARPASPLLVGAFVTATALTPIAVPAEALATGATPAPATAPATATGHPDRSCLADEGDPAWAPTSTRIDPANPYHAYVANGLLGQRVPPHGMGYDAPGDETGYPLYTPRYDGAFVAGLYARDPKVAKGFQVDAAIPTWSTLNVGVGGDTFTSRTATDRISGYRQTLFLRCGLLRTSLTWTAADGRKTDLVYEVTADRNHAHLGTVRLRMVPHWSGTATVTDVLDGAGARRITRTGGGPVPDAADGRAGTPGSTVDLRFRTTGTGVDGSVASTLVAGPGAAPVTGRPRPRPAEFSERQSATLRVTRGRGYEVVKYVGVDTELTSKRPARTAVEVSRRAAERGWAALFAEHRRSWQRLWSRDVTLPGAPDLQQWVRAALYGLYSATRPGTAHSIPPAGLTSDNYAGLIFWDADTWMYPGLVALHPELARSVVEYRHRTIPAAARNARKLGHRGLFYPWTSGATGDLATECHSVDPDHCRMQNHLQSDIALAAWQYYLVTGDTAWLRSRGWPLLKGIAEFWESRVTANADGSYSINHVAGPDEYSNDVDDGVFTNAGAATVLRDAVKAARILGEPASDRWSRIADRLRIPYDEKNGIYLQYAGYEGTRPIKQADTVLLIHPLEWPMDRYRKSRTLDYYARRADPDGPAMTDSAHTVAAAEIGEPGCATYSYLLRSIKPFARAPYAVFSEARGEKAGALDELAGRPAHDFLTGKGGFLQVFTHGLTGMRWREDRVVLDPLLPPQLPGGVTVRGLHWHGRTFDVAVGPEHTTVRLTAGDPFRIEAPEGELLVSTEAPAVLKTRRPDRDPTDNLARCARVTASSEDPGAYAVGAVDGSPVTFWAPDGRQGSVTVDLGRPHRITHISPRWREPRPAAHTVEVSRDGRAWTAVRPRGDAGTVSPPVDARFVRVTVRATGDTRPGIEELTVKGAAAHGR
ncbi:discoidin domain-containing protein [Streptomyces pactum]|uniref:Discoidin domain-containing protein n=1 Tax=Streptomyces pactum TaxID=68249 RepID=A0ABS0NPE5_9ACTN|nr:discoidin domain-containing protein [Streptomyces pactum]MBH5337075.1 discoidin domain-containing protein [Streptomyces pactum]